MLPTLNHERTTRSSILLVVGSAVRPVLVLQLLGSTSTSIIPYTTSACTEDAMYSSTKGRPHKCRIERTEFQHMQST
eukprot:COSAG03_NODE_18877_length_346_cov_1.036437_1_plen_76_part_10